MKKDLISSSIERKNILNNNIAISEIYKALGYSGILFEYKYRFTKEQIASFYEVDERTIDRIIEQYGEEIAQNGYEVFNGEKLRNFKNEIAKVNLSLYENINRAPNLGVFTFKAFLNIGMLLSESERARLVRSMVLDIVIDVLNQRAGGSTKYINQREEKYLETALNEFDCRKEFTNAIDNYIVKNNFKYANLTDLVYKSIFREKAKEYKQILKLSSKESVRATMYSEVLRIVSDYENAFAKTLKEAHQEKGELLTLAEALKLFGEFAKNAEFIMENSINEARKVMASRDLVFRDALHEKLEHYIREVSEEDFDKFLGEQSMALEKRLQENVDVFKRLKDR
ncbi:DNA-binding protein [Capnocytophaga canis]|uniref:DNA-binding protein n=1 Tax=Capnocytophaga TaxID=1016 RepID=UPI001AC85786|nr:DNA-binding protein [Capnocytophaga cynodegmi]GIM54386.1 hypothetical protein CAPN005_10330 [Capnocytophaga cynodegmi]